MLGDRSLYDILFVLTHQQFSLQFIQSAVNTQQKKNRKEKVIK